MIKSLAGYLIPRISAKDLKTGLQIQTQTFCRILRSSAESLRYAAGYLKLIYQAGCSNQPRYTQNDLPINYAIINLEECLNFHSVEGVSLTITLKGFSKTCIKTISEQGES